MSAPRGYTSVISVLLGIGSNIRQGAAERIGGDEANEETEEKK